jgi:hypothetical protein
MKLLDELRTTFHIRKERQLPPPSAKPPVGSSIVYETLRMRLNRPITDEQWMWLINRGWRTVNLRTNRRNYVLVSDKFVNRLLDADDESRFQLHKRLINSPEAAV